MNICYNYILFVIVNVFINFVFVQSKLQNSKIVFKNKGFNSTNKGRKNKNECGKY